MKALTPTKQDAVEFKYPLPVQVDMLALQNRSLTRKPMKTVHAEQYPVYSPA